MLRSTALVGLLLAACTSSADSKVSRPAGATRGTPVAEVVLAGGPLSGSMPTIRDTNDKPFEAKGGLPLLSSDTLVVPPSCFLMVHLLANGQVVRIDEDLEMRVAEIVLLGAPKVSVSVKDQLDRLLTSDDKTAFKTRMIGWKVSPIAANVPSVHREVDVETPAAEEEAMDDVAVRTSAERERAPKRSAAAALLPRAPAPPAPPPPPPPAAKSAPAPVQPLSVTPGGGRGIVTLKDLQKPKEVERKEQEKKADTVSSETARSPFDDEALRACLVREVKALGPRVEQAIGAELDVSFRLKGDTLQLRLEGALPAPQCALELLEPRRSELGATTDWQTKRVRLK